MSLTDLALFALVLLLAAMVIAAVFLSEKRQGAKSYNAPLFIALGLTLWLCMTALLGHFNLLANYYAMPPPIARLLVPSLLIVIALAFSKAGQRLAAGLKLSELVGFQAFRLPVELILLGYFLEGRIPAVMTFEGRNFDVLTAVSAIVVCFLISRGKISRQGVLIWNIAGLALLLNILSIAVLSAPGRFRVFLAEPANSLPFHFPSIWIIFCVLLALLGHLLTFRKLRLNP